MDVHVDKTQVIPFSDFLRIPPILNFVFCRFWLKKRTKNMQKEEIPKNFEKKRESSTIHTVIFVLKAAQNDQECVKFKKQRKTNEKSLSMGK